MDDEGFLRAILDAPEDDAVRLVYADWLEEQGRLEQAEFIRAECEMATIHDEPGFGPNEWDSPRFWELERRCRQLYDRHGRDWFGPHVWAFRDEMSTRRGFPWHVALSARRFIDRAEEIFRAAPTVEDVIINRLGRNMPELARCQALAHVRYLEFFETPFRTREAEEFAASPHLGNLHELRIGFTDTHIGPPGAVALARGRNWRRLERLDVYNHAIYDEGAEALLCSEQLATLTDLNLGNNGLSDETAMALYEADQPNLKSLDLMQNHLGGRGVAALADAAHLAGLERLSLQWNLIGHSGAASLVGAQFVGRLGELRLSGCGLDDQAVAIVFGAAWPTLTELHVATNVLGNEAAETLARNRSLGHLETLNVGRCQIDSAAASLLGRASLPALRTLNAGHNPLRSEGVRALLGGPLVGPVSNLDLEASELGDAGAKVLADSPAVAKVRWLKLPDNRITERGAIVLADSAHLADVQLLDLSRNQIGRKGRDALRRRFRKRVRF